MDVLGDNSWKQVLLSFFVVWARSCTTLYTIPASTQLCATRVGIPLILLCTLQKLLLFCMSLWVLCEFAGFLRVLCGLVAAELRCGAFPLPICRPKGIVPNSEF